jgi:hypothetical protein
VFRALGAVLAAGLVLAAARVPARADTRAPTRFSEFSVTPTSLDVDHPTVTYTGRLIFTGTDGADQGVPGARVCLEKDLRCVATTDTDADGRFTSPVTLSATGDQPQLRDGKATAFFNGDKDNQSTDVRPGISRIPLHRRVRGPGPPARRPPHAGHRFNAVPEPVGKGAKPHLHRVH